VFFASLAILVLHGSVASAQETHKMELTPFVHYRAGGALYDRQLELQFDLKNSFGFGAMFNYKIADFALAEFLYSRQGSELEIGTEDRPAFDLSVNYIHGGILLQGGEKELRPFVVGTLGATVFSPDSANGATRFSIGLGAGFKGLISDRIGYRMEGRTFTTFTDRSQDDVFCDVNGCVSYASAGIFWQAQITGGVVIAF
jgi:hypothetical protein